jgi:hypothetical protein
MGQAAAGSTGGGENCRIRLPLDPSQSLLPAEFRLGASNGS